VYNSTFQKSTENDKGFGITAGNSGPINLPPITLGDPPLPPNFQGINTGYTEISTPTGSYNNAFFDISTAISLATKKMMVEHCDIRSSDDVSNQTNKGDRGIVLGGNNYNMARLNSNNICNIKNAIWFGSNVIDRNTNISEYGSLEVSGNYIADAMPYYNTLPNGGYLRNAIILGYGALYGGYATQLSCNNNTVKNAVNGIKLSGFRGSEIKNNTVSITTDRTNTATNQYGICLEGGLGMMEAGTYAAQNTDGATILQNNAVDGPGMAVNSTGILLSQQMKADIGCNAVGGNAQNTLLGFTHGFRFVGNNPETKFWDNTMKVDNQYGFTLDNGGMIGMQGELTPTSSCSSNNSWGEPNNGHGSSYWQTMPGQYMTNCINSQAMYSKLVVLNSMNYPELNPSGSGYSFPLPGNGYFHLGNLSTDQILYGTTGNCPRCDGANRNYARSAADLTLLEEIADGTVSIFNDDPDERLLAMQQQLYELLQANPTQAMNSNRLQQFMYNNQMTSLDFIHYASKYLAEGDMAMLDMLLGFWPGQSSTLDENYYQYFEWMVAMYYDPNYLPEEQAVFDLANRCPLKDGVVVYAVRNLYNAMTNRINEFTDNCESGQQRSSSGTSKPQFVRLKQPKTKTLDAEIAKSSLVVYPNPANSIVNVSYSKMKQLVITDMTGRTVMTMQLNNENAAQINVSSLSKGMYIIKVWSSDNSSATQKLVIQ